MKRIVALLVVLALGLAFSAQAQVRPQAKQVLAWRDFNVRYGG